MKISSISVASILVAGCAIALLPDASLAQSYPNNSGDSRDPFSRASAGDTSGLMQLINQASLNGRGTRVTSEAQNQQIDAAAEEYGVRQLKAWREFKQKNKPTVPVKPAVK